MSEQTATAKDVVAVIGLGYVGLPLALEFGKLFETIGFDISERKINDCAQPHHWRAHERRRHRLL